MVRFLRKLRQYSPLWEWEGRDPLDRPVRGEIRAGSDTVAKVLLRRQGVQIVSVRRRRSSFERRITEKDIVLFTRQLATMLKAGLPLLQAFELSARAQGNPAASRMLLEVRADLESGVSLTEAFRKRPHYFDRLFCSLVAAGEAGGVLDVLLSKLASYKEKTLALKAKTRAALIYPSTIVVVSFVITAVMMGVVVPAFKALFASFGADLPLPTLMLISLSDLCVRWGWGIVVIVLAVGAGLWFMFRRSPRLVERFDRMLLRLPVLGGIVLKAIMVRWARTLATLITAGVPLLEALDSVGGAAGNRVYEVATRQIQADISSGSSLYQAMRRSGLFPNMALQMASTGEESGSLDAMLGKAADFYEDEVDNAVASLSSLLEPAIMVVLGVLIGGFILAMYLPIFKMGQVVG
ncbi:type II secretion system F family protein [Crenobacter sp. SG2303]|uniref:Type II secretion system F family protein n=1 Tax=Crenobacter oryzisoli TaxID=3056844 RepID=A0ABT7XUR5_9NEIS|nr:type II secretion system F family protein [Crenobacter sp. SG2303]MDN0077289.1 type II secretion system F family protein [Crenobacter sp. SG2303]